MSKTEEQTDREIEEENGQKNGAFAAYACRWRLHSHSHSHFHSLPLPTTTLPIACFALVVVVALFADAATALPLSASLQFKFALFVSSVLSGRGWGMRRMKTSQSLL